MALPVAVVEAAPIDWEVPEEQIGLWQDAWIRFRRNRLAVLGAAVVLFLIAVAVLSPILVQLGLLASPLTQHVESIETPPGVNGHAFGTDILGRDTLARLMVGSQVSLTVGLLVQGIIFPIGLAIGLAAGYFGGRIDNLLMRFTDIWYAFPDLLFVLGLVRGQVLSIKEKEYIEAARSSGTPPLKLILKHLLPNSIGPIIVTLTFGIPNAIFLEAVLSFLGVGIRPPQPTWGQMVADGAEAIYANPSGVVFPALAIGFTLLAFSFIGDGLRDALDPRMRR